MPKIVAIQMDDIATINIDRDTTFALMLEAQKRKYKLYYYQPHQLSLKNGEVIATAQEIKLKRQKNNYYSLKKPVELNLAETDIILMRQDPPFDMSYITYTYLLEKLAPKTLVLNNPVEVRNCPEKLFVTMFSKFMPPTLITSDTAQITKFLKEHKEIVLKPLHSFGGNDIFKATKDNISTLTNKLLKKYKTPLVAQKYLPEIKDGDKRIILINGEIAGTLNRIPQKGKLRSNMAQGGTAVKTTITKREQEICAALKPELKKRRLMLVGIDVIGGYLTEINVTSPTGLQVINGLENICLEAQFWDEVDKMVAAFNK